MEADLSSCHGSVPVGEKDSAVLRSGFVGLGEQGEGVVGVAETGRPTLPLSLGRQGKAKPPKLYRIGEVVDYSGMSRQTIHNYTIMGLLHESKWTNGGHRLYDESVFESLDQIADLKSRNMSMEAIRQHLSDKSR